MGLWRGGRRRRRAPPRSARAHREAPCALSLSVLFPRAALCLASCLLSCPRRGATRRPPALLAARARGARWCPVFRGVGEGARARHWRRGGCCRVLSLMLWGGCLRRSRGLSFRWLCVGRAVEWVKRKRWGRRVWVRRRGRSRHEEAGQERERLDPSITTLPARPRKHTTHEHQSPTFSILSNPLLRDPSTPRSATIDQSPTPP